MPSFLNGFSNGPFNIFEIKGLLYLFPTKTSITRINILPNSVNEFSEGEPHTTKASIFSEFFLM